MQSLVWAGALNRHAHAAFGVEEEGRTVAITQFTRTVYGRMIGRDEGEAEGVATTERGRDLGIAADGVAFAGEVGAEGRDELEDDAEIGGDRSLRGVECIRQGGALHRQRGRWDADGGRDNSRCAMRGKSLIMLYSVSDRKVLKFNAVNWA